MHTHEWPNERSGVDAGGALRLHIGRDWPGATHRERSCCVRVLRRQGR